MQRLSRLLKPVHDTNPFDPARLAVFAMIERARNVAFERRAPHAYCGTFPRPRRRASSVLAPRLFKGHRP